MRTLFGFRLISIFFEISIMKDWNRNTVYSPNEIRSQKTVRYRYDGITLGLDYTRDSMNHNSFYSFSVFCRRSRKIFSKHVTLNKHCYLHSRTRYVLKVRHFFLEINQIVIDRLLRNIRVVFYVIDTISNGNVVFLRFTYQFLYLGNRTIVPLSRSRSISNEFSASDPSQTCTSDG